MCVHWWYQTGLQCYNWTIKGLLSNFYSKDHYISCSSDIYLLYCETGIVWCKRFRYEKVSVGIFFFSFLSRCCNLYCNNQTINLLIFLQIRGICSKFFALLLSSIFTALRKIKTSRFKFECKYCIQYYSVVDLELSVQPFLHHQTLKQVW